MVWESEQETGYYAGIIASAVHLGRLLCSMLWGYLADVIGMSISYYTLFYKKPQIDRDLEFLYNSIVIASFYVDLYYRYERDSNPNRYLESFDGISFRFHHQPILGDNVSILTRMQYGPNDRCKGYRGQHMR